MHGQEISLVKLDRLQKLAETLILTSLSRAAQTLKYLDIQNALPLWIPDIPLFLLDQQFPSGILSKPVQDGPRPVGHRFHSITVLISPQYLCKLFPWNYPVMMHDQVAQ